MNAICLVIDGLQAGYLGTYGNTWCRTPEFNRLAASGFVFDHAYFDSPRLESIYRAFWSGLHAQVKPAFVDQLGVAQRLADAGVYTSLICDDALIAEHPLAHGFREKLLLRPGTLDSQQDLPDDIGDTQQALFFAELVGQLATVQQPFAVWAHTRGLTGAWDSPWHLREQLLAEEEDDLENVRSHLAELRQAPHAVISSDVDPDDLLALRFAYAAQVQVLDTCLAGFMQALDELPAADSTLLVVLAPRGYALGAHQRIGHERPELHEELTHIPLMVRLPKQQAVAARSQALVQPSDLAATLYDWFECPSPLAPTVGAGRTLLPVVRGEQSAVQDRLLLTDEASVHAIRTTGWYMIREQTEAEPNEADSGHEISLYAKPDDRWELNEVADRCPEVADELHRVLDELAGSTSENRDCELTPLESILVEGVS